MPYKPFKKKKNYTIRTSSPKFETPKKPMNELDQVIDEMLEGKDLK